MQKWRGPHPKKEKTRKGAKQQSRSQEARLMSNKGGKIHGISACSTSWLPVAIPAPPPSPSPSPLIRKQLLRAHTLLPILAVPASLPTPTILLALSILSHIVLHSTYFPLYIP